jgi:hypothetical protein
VPSVLFHIRSEYVLPRMVPVKSAFQLFMICSSQVVGR